jgi:hypothetical protein
MKPGCEKGLARAMRPVFNAENLMPTDEHARVRADKRLERKAVDRHNQERGRSLSPAAKMRRTKAAAGLHIKVVEKKASGFVAMRMRGVRGLTLFTLLHCLHVEPNPRRYRNP